MSGLDVRRPQAGQRYRAISESLWTEIRNGQIPPGGRLPSERTLATRYGVHRLTVRRALQELKGQGLVYADRRGTFARERTALASVDRMAEAPAQDGFPGGIALRESDTPRVAWFGFAPAAEEHRTLLGVEAGARVLAHHHEVVEGDRVVQVATSAFGSAVVAEVPHLLRESIAAAAGREPDVRDAYRWMRDAGLRPRRRDSVTVRNARSEGEGGAGVEGPVMVVYRVVRDQYGRSLATTRFEIAADRAELVYG
ncbi:GntR family transcriptional regulator [Wenjunlia tyrosinilytica]|uniref:HTH gntR-type domain-containing protein n=1 Tax=Wenjunlia tyrosinilytica TaxID=1544741 RepID=A0A918DY49_9ACTN|nr:GntR family transcriptional regulator [Wenjunlia tyrosinilytica]GGO90945.1 hypothetical protein GCM10012280_37650 [Wenjunlia tyrosinilytica]